LQSAASLKRVSTELGLTGSASGGQASEPHTVGTVFTLALISMTTIQALIETSM
jgi:hypothetical protein